MNRYQISSPRQAFAMAALVLTAITIGLAVVVPAKMLSGARDPRTPTASTATTPAPVEVAAKPLHIDVVGIREPEFVSAHLRNVTPKRKQES